MNEADRSAAAETLIRFFGHLDAGKYDALVMLAAEDVIWTRLNKPLAGRPAILEALAQRNPARHTCHVLTNFIVDPVPNGLRLSALMLAFHGEVAELGEPVALEGVAAIRRIEAELRASETGFLVRRLSDSPLFVQLKN